MVVNATEDMAKANGAATRQLADEALPKLFNIRLDPRYTSWHTMRTAGAPIDWGKCTFSGIDSGRTMGSGANLIIIDDYFRNVADALSESKREKHRAWFLSCMETRLAPGGSIIIMGTRWHIEDLIGDAKKSAKQTGEEWDIVSLPALAEHNDQLGRKPGEALWPEQFDEKHFERVRRNFEVRGYLWMFNALYQQHPPTSLDSEFPQEYFSDHIWVDKIPSDCILKITSLDPSKGKTDKADYSAWVNIGVSQDGTVYVESVLERADVATLAKKSAQILKAFNPDYFVCEINQFQELLQIDIVRECEKLDVDVKVLGIDNTLNKLVRIRRLSPMLASGKIKFVRDVPGNNLIVEQLGQFPGGTHDDGPDSLDMGISVADSMVTLANYFQEPPNMEGK